MIPSLVLQMNINHNGKIIIAHFQASFAPILAKYAKARVRENGQSKLLKIG